MNQNLDSRFPKAQIMSLFSINNLRKFYENKSRGLLNHGGWEVRNSRELVELINEGIVRFIESRRL